MSLLVLSARDVEEAVTKFTADELIGLMARVFHSTSLGPVSEKEQETQQPHRSVISTPHHKTLFMPARMRPFGTAVKVVSVPTPSAPLPVRERGLPASTLVLDDETGEARAFVNARNLTALRNAAGSLLATRLLLGQSSPVKLVAFGAGAQIQAHVLLFLKAYPSITTCTVINRTLNIRLLSLLSTLRSAFPSVDFQSHAMPAGNSESEPLHNEILRAALQAASIVITATSSTSPLFPSAYVSSGTHLCLIGSYTPSMHEVDSALVRRAGKVVVDSRASCKMEAGELISAGLNDEDMVEIGELIKYPEPSIQTDEIEARQSWISHDAKIRLVKASGDVTVFKSVGVGVQDVAIAHAVVELANKHQLGRRVDDFD